MLTVGSLFAGIGGFDLGFERAGMRTLWFCEQDPFCQRVLAKHWPGVPCHLDVRALKGIGADPNGEWSGRVAPDWDQCSDASEGLRTPVANASINGRRQGRPGGSDSAGAGKLEPALQEGLSVLVPYVDVLCGGFPCQDISLAGHGAGLAGERSGLWREFARLIGELRPRYVVIENVPALTSRGLSVVLADLAACGFDAEWDHFPASAFGAPHRRDRIWLVAYPGGDDGRQGWARGSAPSGSRQPEPVKAFQDVADAGGPRLEGDRASRPASNGAGQGTPWAVEPDVRGVVDGPAEELDGGLNGRQGHGAVASPSKGAEGLLRDVWEHVATRAASSGRGSDEQLARELADALPVLPHGMALGEREGALAPARAYVQGLRQALSSLGAMSDPSQPIAPAWLALPREDQSWIDLGVAGGQWSAEWPGVERVAHAIPNRVDRLRALGNALVPQIAEWIGGRIVEWERNVKAA